MKHKNELIVPGHETQERMGCFYKSNQNNETTNKTTSKTKK